MRRTVLALALILLALRPFPSLAWTLFFEAVPVAGYTLPGLANAPYAERLALTRAAVDGVVPQVAASLGLAGKMSPVAIGPCGTRLMTQPAMRVDVATDRTAALHFAAALGYVFRQSAVLAVDFDDARGGTPYGVVALPPGPLDAAMAHRFYLHAAGAEPKLIRGYGSLPEGLVFFHFGREDPEAFLAALRRAAASFDEPGIRFVRTGRARAELVVHDWVTDAEGHAYRQRFSPGFLTLLDQAAGRNQALIDRLAERFRWRPPPGYREAEPQATSHGP